ncbi:MAG: hypothetical protein ACKVZJ_06425 [Phycisphaerales bacterium]
MKIRTLQSAILVFLGLCAAAAADGAPSVSWTGPGSSATVTSVGTDLYDIVLTKSFGSATDSSDFTITSSGATDKIRKLIVRNREPIQLLRVNLTNTGTRIASVGSIEYGTGNDGAGHNDYDGMAFILAMKVAGNVGDIKVTRVFNSIIDGSVTGVIDMPAINGYSSLISGVEVLGSVLGNITLNEVSTSNRSVIDDLRVRGTIGTSTSPVTIKVGQAINLLFAGELNADIIGTASGTGYYSYVEWINRIEIGDFGRYPGASGNIRGLIKTNLIGVVSTVDNHIWCSGDLAGTIALNRAHATRTPASATPEIKTTKAGGLKGQVIICAGNENAHRTWTAPVKVGPDGAGQLNLANAAYANTAASLGGGAIGLMSYRLHPEDCFPVEAGTSTPADLTVAARHKGPVGWSSGTPLKVLHRAIGGSTYGDNLTGCFSIALDSTNATIVNMTATGFVPVGDYQVTPETGVLKSAVLGNLVTDVTPYTYSFSVRHPCVGDFNGDNTVDTADLVTFLGQFGQSGACGNNRDLDGDLAVNTADLTLFLGQFGNTCSSGRPGSGEAVDATGSRTLSGGGVTREVSDPGRSGDGQATMPPVLAALGFVSIEQYTAYIDGLSPQELSAHIVQLLETIEELSNP